MMIGDGVPFKGRISLEDIFICCGERWFSTKKEGDGLDRVEGVDGVNGVKDWSLEFLEPIF